MRKKGTGKVANVCNRSKTGAIKVCLLLHFAVVFDFNLFPVPPSTAKLNGNVFMNRQNAVIRSLGFFSFITCIAN